jgi:hypothetical protein
MQKFNMAHLRVQGIDFAVFDADAQSDSDSSRASVLSGLTMAARQKGLKVDKSALAFSRAGRIQFYGASDLVDYLAARGVPSWTHTITI